MASIQEVQLNGQRPLPPTTGASASRTTHRVYSTDRCRNNALRQIAPMSADEPQAIRTEVRHFEVTAEEAGQRLDNYLQRVLAGVPRSRVYRVIRKGEVRVNGRRAGPELRLQLHDRIRIPPLRLPPAVEPGQPPADMATRVRQAIVHEDQNLIVLDKPSGIAVHGGSGLSFGVIEALRAQRPGETLELVHRLDRDTSGCLIVARRPAV